jgi:hypothetical protein
MSSALNGSMSDTRTPTTSVRELRRLRATMLDSKPSSSMTACTRAEVADETPYRSLITLETVATETPATSATSRIVARRPVGTMARLRIENGIDNA